MKSFQLKTLVAAAAALLVSGTALADVNIGVSLSLTGPGSGLGIPMQNQLKLFPPTIAGNASYRNSTPIVPSATS